MIAISVTSISLFSYLGFIFYCSEKTVREAYKYKKKNSDPNLNESVWKYSKTTMIPQEEDIQEENNQED
jgi:hypothetical protein